MIEKETVEVLVKVPVNEWKCLEDQNFFGKPIGEWQTKAIHEAIIRELDTMVLHDLKKVRALELKYGLAGEEPKAVVKFKKDKAGVNLALNIEATKLFREIKTHYHMTYNGSVMGMLLTNEASRIRHLDRTAVLIPDKDYEILDKEAQKQGLTVDEYVDKICRERLPEIKGQLEKA